MDVYKTDKDVHGKGKKDMWLEKLIELKDQSGLSLKQIAEKSHISEKTVTRIFAGGASRPYLDTLGDIAAVLNSSLEDIFSESHARLATSDCSSLQTEMDRLTAEKNMLAAENAVLKDKVGSLTTEIDLLRIKLEHKDEIISLHNYYNSILKNMDKI